MIELVDVGCRNADADPWINNPDIHVIGFDVDAAEIIRLRERQPRHAWYAVPLGSSNAVVPFFETAVNYCSSPLRPLSKEQFGDMNRELHLVSERRIGQDVLDEWEIDCDILKLDVQGYELEVLKGAEKTLQKVGVVQCEVEFNPLYENQPLFPAIDGFLRERGFELYDLRNLHYLSGQLYWADAFYLRPGDSARALLKEVIS